MSALSVAHPANDNTRQRTTRREDHVSPARLAGQARPIISWIACIRFPFGKVQDVRLPLCPGWWLHAEVGGLYMGGCCQRPAPAQGLCTSLPSAFSHQPGPRQELCRFSLLCWPQYRTARTMACPGLVAALQGSSCSSIALRSCRTECVARSSGCEECHAVTGHGRICLEVCLFRREFPGPIAHIL